MALAVKHKFVSPKSDGTDSTLVKPSNWNDVHIITILAGHLVGLPTGPDGAAIEIGLTTNFDLSTATLDLSDTVVFPGTGAVQVPQGTTAERPDAPTEGMLRYNTDLNAFEKFENSEWSPTSTAPGDQTVAGNLTVTKEIICTGTGDARLPVGTTGQRPVTSPSPTKGMIRFNSDTNKFEGYDGTSWRSISWVGDAVAVPKPHTVLYGPMDANGYASFFPSSTANLNISTSGIASGTPLEYTLGNGYTASGAQDLVVQLTANIAFNGLTASKVNYLGFSYNPATSVTSAIKTTTKWNAQYGGSIPTTAGQYTYDINRRQMYLGDGSNANPVNVIFVAEATCSATAVTSAVCYAYQRRYSFINNAGSLPGNSTLVSKNCNIGTNVGLKTQLGIIIRTATGNFTAGTIVRNIACVSNAGGTAYGNMAVWSDGYVISFGTTNFLNWQVYASPGGYASFAGWAADYVLDAWTDW